MPKLEVLKQALINRGCSDFESGEDNLIAIFNLFKKGLVCYDWWVEPEERNLFYFLEDQGFVHAQERLEYLPGKLKEKRWSEWYWMEDNISKAAEEQPEPVCKPEKSYDDYWKEVEEEKSYSDGTE